MTEDQSRTDTTETKHNPEKSKQHKTQRNKTSLVQSLLTTLGQETRRAYSTTLPNPHGACSGWIKTVPVIVHNTYLLTYFRQVYFLLNQKLDLPTQCRQV